MMFVPTESLSNRSGCWHNRLVNFRLFCARIPDAGGIRLLSNSCCDRPGYRFNQVCPVSISVVARLSSSPQVGFCMRFLRSGSSEALRMRTTMIARVIVWLFLLGNLLGVSLAESDQRTGLVLIGLLAASGWATRLLFPSFPSREFIARWSPSSYRPSQDTGRKDM